MVLTCEADHHRVGTSERNPRARQRGGGRARVAPPKWGAEDPSVGPTGRIGRLILRPDWDDGLPIPNGLRVARFCETTEFASAAETTLRIRWFDCASTADTRRAVKALTNDSSSGVLIDIAWRLQPTYCRRFGAANR